MSVAEHAALLAARAELAAGQGWAAEAILQACAGNPGAAALLLLRKGRVAEAQAEIGARLAGAAQPTHA